MHIEVLVEDSSGAKLLDVVLPKILGEQGKPHTWRLHAYKGIGRIPGDAHKAADPAKRILLSRLPQVLRGYGRTQGIDAVVVVLDNDSRDCREFLSELKELAVQSDAPTRTVFRLAIEEMEAWYMGDRDALLAAYPRANKAILDKYVQDSICGTWEILADAIYKGGSKALKDAGWPLPGQVKHEWAEQIGPLLDLERNESPSFQELRDGVRSLIEEEAP
jgi:hypothetical protein